MQNEIELPSPLPLEDWIREQSVALFLDFDGTLVEIAETPDGIQVSDDLPVRLEHLSAGIGGRLALVTGRALSDIHSHLGANSLLIVGSHGAEFSDAADKGVTLSNATLDEIAPLLAQWPGLLLESKPHGIAIHYRQEPAAEPVVLTIMQQVAEWEGLSVRRGKMVVELGPANVNKGWAVTLLMAQPPFIGAMPIFIGDDVTDEDGFAAAEAAGGFGILVGSARATAARYRLKTIQEVYHWLGL